MPTLLDKIARPLATRMLRQFGSDIVLTKVVQGAYVPGNSVAPQVEQSYEVKALVEDYNLVDSGTGFAAGLIEMGDKKVTLAAEPLSFDPSAGDTITVSNIKYTVIRVLTTYSGEQKALFEIQARK